MLTIQPNFSSLNCKKPTFRASSEQKEEISETLFKDDFNIDDEKKATKEEYDLWQGTKRNLEQIAKNTESVPVIKKGTDVLSGLTAVAIGWGGLRWGTVGTLEILSKAAKTDLGKKVKGIGTFIKTQAKNLKTWISELSISKAVAGKFSGLKTAFLETPLGKRLSSVKTAIVESNVYKSTANWFKSLNPKRVFVETMGVAGGGTAALETLGVHTVDGTANKVETDDKGNYSVNGKEVDFEPEDGYTNVA